MLLKLVMVMEAIPSPDAVGREFVRQYYTLLNRAPTHAHRFYNSNSYFVHGAMSKPAIGQKQIHQKIQQLNFRDCHAKISQVDSQATLGNGLVVQVSGELSNDGEPMRRFTQTFVLGTHSPRMYYVHNDIFRYQDMLLSDEEGETQPSNDDADQHQDVQPDQGQTAGNIQYFNTSTSAPVEAPMAPNPGTGQNVSLNGTALHNENLQAGQTPHVPQQEPTPVINGRVVDLNIVNDVNDVNYMLASQTNAQPDMKSPKEKINRTAANKVVEPEDAAPNEQDATQNESEGFAGEIQEMNIVTEVSNEPKTYANLLKMDRVGSGLSSTSSATVINRSTPIFNAMSGSGQRLDENTQQGRPPRAPVRGGPTRGNNRKERSSGPSRSSFNDDGGTLVGNNTADNQERRRNPVQYNDNHQLFMGNLPLDATEEELRELFSKFGTIVDLRIHSKTSSGTKGPPGSRVPNYGFITFENPQSVQEVLNSKPICFPKEGGIKLNVEEKKIKPRSSIPPQGGGGSGGGGGGSNSTGGGGSAGGNESNWSAGRAPPRGGPSTRGSRGGGARVKRDFIA
ncbi:hypothetical protein RUM44_004040 [Polyplax serrata]|uniref:Ras GTPase-activating protein-binding protein 2 n=1 Tax=Polyplax serrata TaxID=468196 RepID=A0ABR1B1P8_POLSC